MSEQDGVASAVLSQSERMLIGLYALTEADIAVYRGLCQDAPRTAQDLIDARVCAPASVYRGLNRLVEEGLVTVRSGWPRAYLRLSADELAAHQRSVLRQRLEALEGPHTVERADHRYARAVSIVQGRAGIYEGLKADLDAVQRSWDFVATEANAAAWCQVAGLLSAHTPRGVTRRHIYADTDANRRVVAAMGPLPGVEVRFINVDGCMRFAIADGRRLTSIITPSMSRHFDAPAEVAMQTDYVGLVESQARLFDALWY